MKIVFLLFETLILFNNNFANTKKKKWDVKLEKTDSVCSIYKQFYKETEEGVVFSTVIQAPNLNKNELFPKCIETLALAYKDSKEVIQTKNEDNGTILGKGTFIRESKGGIIYVYKKCEHVIKIEVKEERCRVSIILNEYYEFAQGSKSGLKSENTFSIKQFYPFKTGIESAKDKVQSFLAINFCMEDALGVLKYFEHQINKQSNQEEDDW